MPQFTSWQEAGIDLPHGSHTGQKKIQCPKCAENGARDKSLSVNYAKGVFNCHRPSCGYKGWIVSAEKLKERTKKEWKPIVPSQKVKPITEKNDSVLQWLCNERKLSLSVLLNKPEIVFGKAYYSQHREERTSVGFRYYDGTDLMMCKYRTRQKDMTQDKDGTQILYRLNHAKYTDQIIICEGELDSLCFVQAGFDYATSVPNGAGDTELKCLENCAPYLEQKTTIYLATDNDGPGLDLREKLARRLGKLRCKIVNFPAGCKDANDVLIKYTTEDNPNGGVEMLRTCVQEASDFPIAGAVDIMDVWDELENIRTKGYPKGLTTDTALDDIITWHPGELTTITGHANHGKTPFVLHTLCKLALKGHKSAIFSPEYSSLSINAISMIQTLLGRPVEYDTNRGRERINQDDFKVAVEFLRQHVKEIRPVDNDYSIDIILEIAASLVLSMGISMLVIDHWKTIDLPADTDQRNGSKAILNKLKRFAIEHEIHVIIIAHPTSKQHIKQGDSYNLSEITSLAQVAESGEFLNLSDNGIAVHRHFDGVPDDKGRRVDLFTSVKTLKVKNHWVGRVGTTYWKFRSDMGRYMPVNKEAFFPQLAQMEQNNKMGLPNSALFEMKKVCDMDTESWLKHVQSTTDEGVQEDVFDEHHNSYSTTAPTKKSYSLEPDGNPLIDDDEIPF